ncbi:MAG: hypothetical protein O6913_06400 [Chloroflexi bacterium]|jgi:methanogenic corrinoid protein MtbC1|nr:hypothetical protein [Chloroflexota bacterium]MCZ6706694.1 hypothetical protein [Chloroflexota bacterium]
MSTTTPTARYFDALLRNSEVLAEAAAEADARGVKLNRQLREGTIALQRDTVELAKKLSGGGLQPAELISTCLESGLHAQSQTLQLAQTFSEDAIDASSRAHESIESISQANREVADATLSLCAAGGAWNPFLAAFAPKESPSPTSADPADGETPVDA